MFHKPFLRLTQKHVARNVNEEASCSCMLMADFPLRIRWQKSRKHVNGIQSWIEQCVNGVLEWWLYEEQVFANGSPYLTP